MGSLAGSRTPTQISEVGIREHFHVAGIVTSITYAPVSEHPELVVRLTDESGTLDLIFVGRSDVVGIEIGRMVNAQGMVTQRDGRVVIYNPTYELVEAP